MAKGLRKISINHFQKAYNVFDLVKLKTKDSFSLAVLKERISGESKASLDKISEIQWR